MGLPLEQGLWRVELPQRPEPLAQTQLPLEQRLRSQELPRSRLLEPEF